MGDRWRFVTHAGIDGYSRRVVFLGISNNNRASTVFRKFQSAVDELGIPARVRYAFCFEPRLVSSPCNQH
jgi:hypothetical protein